MGASFCVYEETRDSVNIGYGMVGRCRRLLLRILGLSDLYDIATRYLNDVGHERRGESVKAWIRLCDELDLKAQTSDIVRGIKIFVTHSDCDGEFSAEEC